MVFRGEKQFDESEDAAMVAKHFNCNHHEVELTKNDLLETADKILNHSDEPFADSSSIAMHALSHKVRPQIKVALSGDGGDELFAGYYKHLALYYSFEHPFWCQALRLFSPIINLLPSSREEGLSNSLRKLQRFSTSAGLPPAPRYWNWAGYGNPLKPYKNNTLNADTFLSEIHEKKIETFDDCLKMDLRMVLEGDMLVKTDRMSMMNGLEVRVPFLDHNFVEMVSRIPSGIKIAKNDKKMLLKESFAHMLPEEILNKQKHGFEVPLKKYLQSDLSNHLNTFLDESQILDQGIFDIKSIRKGKRMLMRKNSGNAEYSLWNLMIFNSWYQRNKDMIEA